MIRERRRYFRCVAEVPVLLVQMLSGADCKCTTINVSSNGVALKGASPLQPGEEIYLILFLQVVDTVVRAIGTVVWDDKHGKAGISFRCANRNIRSNWTLGWMANSIFVVWMRSDSKKLHHDFAAVICLIFCHEKNQSWQGSLHFLNVKRRD
jgi:hypothetical protein